MSKIRVPRCQFIGGQAEKLYEAETQRDKAIEKCAKAWSEFTNTPKEKFWSDAIPQALFDTLTGYERSCAYAAARAFVEFAESDARYADAVETFKKSKTEHVQILFIDKKEENK